MTVELAYDGTTQVTLVGVVVATSATLAVTSPDDVATESPTVTVPTVTTTTTSGTTANILELAAVTGIAPGDALQVLSDGVRYACTAAVVDSVSKTVELVTGLPVIPDMGSTVAKTQLTASVSALGTANIGPNWRLVWTYSDGTTTRKVAIGAAVVRQLWTSPITVPDVRRTLAEMSAKRSNQWCADVVQRVNDSLLQRVEATGRRPWAFLSSSAFIGAARQGIRYELALQGIAHGGQIYEAQRELRFAFDDALSGVVGSLAYDQNDDGKIDEDEARPSLGTIQAIR